MTKPAVALIGVGIIGGLVVGAMLLRSHRRGSFDLNPEEVPWPLDEPMV